MQSFSILLGLAGLVKLALAQPTGGNPDVTARSAWMVQYCGGTGISGSCSQDTDDNVNYCLTSGAIGSAVVYDGFECWFWTNSDCTGTTTPRPAGTWPEFPLSLNSVSCSRV